MVFRIGWKADSAVVRAVRYICLSVSAISGRSVPLFQTVLLGLLVFGVPLLLDAQRSTPTLPTGTSNTPSQITGSPVTTDTGALAPGHRDFSRYHTPALCAAAVSSELQASRRTLAAQAAARVPRNPVHDTLPITVMAVARRCVAQFSLRTTSVQDLPSLFALFLTAGEDALADTIVAQRLMRASTDSQRTKVFVAALNGYLAATPARIDAARALITRAAQTDNPGETAQLWLQLQIALLNFWALARPDAPERAQFADSILSFVHAGRATGVAGGEQQSAVGDAYRALMSITYLKHANAPDSAVLRLVQQARNDLSRIRPDTVWYDPRSSPQVNTPNKPTVVPAGRSAADMHAAGYTMQVIGRDWATVPLPALLRLIAPAGVLVGDSSRRNLPLNAVWSSPVSADTIGDTSTVLTLRYWLPDACLAAYVPPLSNAGCSVPLSQLQQWSHLYGHRLSLTVVARLHGHALYAGPQPIDAEAQTIVWYVREYWHIPATVAVLGRLTAEAQTNEDDISDPRLEIINKMGQVLYRGDMIGDHKGNDLVTPFLNTLLVHALSPAAASIAPAASVP